MICYTSSLESKMIPVLLLGHCKRQHSCASSISVEKQQYLEKRVSSSLKIGQTSALTSSEVQLKLQVKRSFSSVSQHNLGGGKVSAPMVAALALSRDLGAQGEITSAAIVKITLHACKPTCKQDHD